MRKCSEKVRNLYELFFYAPDINGILVYEDYSFLGIVFKKDIEKALKSDFFDFYSVINPIMKNQIELILFKKNPKPMTRIPVVDKSGNTVRIISYDEYLSMTKSREFIDSFKVPPMVAHIDSPLFITNFFKKVLYTNKKGFELAEYDIVDKKISGLLRSLDIQLTNHKVMEVRKNSSLYHLIMLKSETNRFFYRFYIFYK